jgi:ankyrin repeat protein
VNVEAVRVLVSGGANVDAADKCGVTPLRLALLDSRVESQALPMAQILVAAGAAVNAKSSCSPETLIEIAEKKGFWKVRQLLLSKGAMKTAQ